MLCLNYLNKTVELLFILYNFAIVPSVGTGIKVLAFTAHRNAVGIVPSVGTGIKAHKFLMFFQGLLISYPPWVRGLKPTYLWRTC